MSAEMKMRPSRQQLLVSNRRRLLQGLGLAGGSLFLPSLIGDRSAYAQGAAKRLVIFFTQHGPVYERWKMRRPGLAETASDWEFPFDDANAMSFSETLRPLHPHRQNLLVLDGLAITSAIFDVNTNNHNAGNSHMLTGAKMLFPGGFKGEGSGGATSVDQVISTAVAQPGRIRELHYEAGGSPVDPSGYVDPWTPVFNGTAEVKGENKPSRAFDRLFPPGIPVGTKPSEADLIRKAQGSVLNLAKGEYAALLPKLGSEDRAKLQKHRDMILGLEMQLQATPPSAGCTAPPKPGDPFPRKTKADLFLKLIPAGLACDLSRVAVLVHGQMDSSEFGGPAGADVHQDIAHAAGPTSPAGIQMTNYYKIHAQQFADLIAAFKAVPEGNGTMLDNSTLVWMTELANGPHDLYRIMVVMAGSGGGAFRTGRYIKYAENTAQNPKPNAGNGRGSAVGPSHNRLLVSLMQAMGMPNNTIGYPSATGAGGAKIEMSGPLPRLA